MTNPADTDQLYVCNSAARCIDEADCPDSKAHKRDRGCDEECKGIVAGEAYCIPLQEVTDAKPK